VKAQINVCGRRLIALEVGTVVRFPARRRPQQERPADPLAGAQALIAEWAALPAREQNYQSSRFADLFYRALRELAASCAPLQEEHARQLADIMRRAQYGDGPARALAAQERPRHLRAVDGPGR
jgi:hypothetical protein